jgi:hypothetical protein
MGVSDEWARDFGFARRGNSQPPENKSRPDSGVLRAREIVLGKAIF